VRTSNIVDALDVATAHERGTYGTTDHGPVHIQSMFDSTIPYLKVHTFYFYVGDYPWTFQCRFASPTFQLAGVLAGEKISTVLITSHKKSNQINPLHTTKKQPTTMSCCSADGTQKMKLHVLPVCKYVFYASKMPRVCGLYVYASFAWTGMAAPLFYPEEFSNCFFRHFPTFNYSRQQPRLSCHRQGSQTRRKGSRDR
jgi:hypothetical protein